MFTSAISNIDLHQWITNTDEDPSHSIGDEQ